jgi:hypothetical protein
VYRDGSDGAGTRAFVRITPSFISCLVSGEAAPAGSDALPAANASNRLEAWKTLDSSTKGIPHLIGSVRTNSIVC